MFGYWMMVKLLAIGDLHGRDCWMNINFEGYDRVIFIGDYVDGTTRDDAAVFRNLQNVIALKEKDPDKIILLLGNHDIHYLHYPDFMCSGTRPSMQKKLTTFFKQKQHLFQVAWQIKNYLFTHAGISTGWYKDFKTYIARPEINFNPEDFDTMADMLNAVEQSKYKRILHQVGYIRGGDTPFGGITWADKIEVEAEPLTGFHQIVGHTRVPDIRVADRFYDTSVTFIDVLESQEQYLEATI